MPLRNRSARKCIVPVHVWSRVLRGRRKYLDLDEPRRTFVLVSSCVSGLQSFRHPSLRKGLTICAPEQAENQKEPRSQDRNSRWIRAIISGQNLKMERESFVWFYWWLTAKFVYMDTDSGTKANSVLYETACIYRAYACILRCDSSHDRAF